MQRRWPLVAVAGLLGSLLAFVFTQLWPPLYESEVTIRVGIHYSITEPLELVVEDRALAHVENLIVAEDTFHRVFERLSQEQRESRGWRTPRDLRQALRLDRRLSSWGLVAGDHDPVFAAHLAGIWGQEALSAVRQAIGHAWGAWRLVNQTLAQNERGQVVGLKGGIRTIWQCQIVPLDVPSDLLDGALQRELALSHGVFPSTYVEHLWDAYVPTEPVLWGRGPLILGSTLVGLLVGLWIAGWIPVRADKELSVTPPELS